jgi:hypothetical protein
MVSIRAGKFPDFRGHGRERPVAPMILGRFAVVYRGPLHWSV